MAKYKQSETVTIQRSVIFFAPYNPRKENKHVVDELKRNFKKVGYLGGIVWNQNTGNLVGGHKRVQALDLIHEYDGSIDKDYELKVEMINVDEKTEKEQNIFLNNRRVQGETDYELLSSMLSDIDIENTGLDERDIDVIKTIIPDFNFGNNEQILNDAELLKTDYNERKEKIKELKKNIKKGISENQMNTHFIVTFKTYDEKAEFLESIGINGDDTYITSDVFLKRIR